MIEWRKLDAGQSWHLFFGNKSLCGRMTSNGRIFNATETKPPSSETICQLCIKDSLALKERFKEIL